MGVLVKVARVEAAQIWRFLLSSLGIDTYGLASSALRYTYAVAWR